MNRHYVDSSPLLQPAAFLPLPLGSVKPRGWLLDQLRVQANGLTGHLEEYWPDLGQRNMWLGGDIEGWERAPYYLAGRAGSAGAPAGGRPLEGDGGALVELHFGNAGRFRVDRAGAGSGLSAL